MISTKELEELLERLNKFDLTDSEYNLAKAIQCVIFERQFEAYSTKGKDD